jgi:6-phosphogluconate dehydrogenase
MGSALALNLADNGFRVAVSNREHDRIGAFVALAGDLAENIEPHDDLEQLVAALPRPRTVLFMVPSGAIMDDLIASTRHLFDDGDTIIDAGNADYHDTRRRAAALEPTGLHFVGMGVSGGEEGARRGPSMMVGGSDHSWQQLKPMARAIAADFNGDPCVAHVGPDGAGHFVKTVHNGIEYADMQMIAEVYGMLRDGAGMTATDISAIFEGWRSGPLSSFLTDITAHVLTVVDPETNGPLVDVIMDKAGQKGTGRWTAIEALKLGQSGTTIEAAVAARSWSAEKETRELAEPLLDMGVSSAEIPDESVLEKALLAGRILGHAQGFRILASASGDYGWQLDMPRIAEIWRAGCIIRSALLDDIAAAFRSAPPAGEMLLAPSMRARLADTIPALRQVVATAAMAGLPVPALAAALAFHDSMARGRGTANLTQAQRDYFGAHTFQRIDKEGVFHDLWKA